MINSVRRNLLWLFGSGIFFWSSLGVLLPTLPVYLRDLRGSLQDVGLITGVFAIGLLCLRPWLGYTADRLGRKPILLVGIISVATAPLGYLLLTSLPGLLAVRAYHGLSVAAFTIAYLAWVVDLVPLAKRGEIIGYMTLVNPIGISLGPALGGLIWKTYGYPTLFITASGLGVLSFCCAHIAQENFQIPRSIPNSLGNPPGKIQNDRLWFIIGLPLTLQLGGVITLVSGVGWLSQHTILQPYQLLLFLPIYTLAGILGFNLHQPHSMVWRPSIRILALALLLLGVSFGTVTTFISLFIQAQGLTFNPGWFYSASALASFGVRLGVGRFSDRYGRGLFITLSFLSYTLAMVQLAQATALWQFLGAGMFEGAGFGLLISMTSAIVADRSSPEERGRALSISFAGLDVGIAVAGPILGGLADQQGYNLTFQLAAVLAGLALIIFLLGCNPTPRRSLAFGLGFGSDDYAVNQPDPKQSMGS